MFGEKQVTNDFLLFFFLFWLLLSLQMPTLHSLIPLHLSISLIARMVSFACGNLGLIHLERPTTMGVRIPLDRKEYQLLRFNDWQSPCNYSYTSWYPVCCSLLPPVGIYPVCSYLQFFLLTGTEEGVVKNLFWFPLLSMQTTIFSFMLFGHRRSFETEG